MKYMRQYINFGLLEPQHEPEPVYTHLGELAHEQRLAAHQERIAKEMKILKEEQDEVMVRVRALYTGQYRKKKETRRQAKLRLTARYSKQVKYLKENNVIF